MSIDRLDLINAWSVLEALRVSLDRIGSFACTHGETAAAGALWAFTAPPLYERIAKAERTLEELIEREDPALAASLPELAEDEGAVGYWRPVGSSTTEMPTVFIDPGGEQGGYLLLLVRHPTGVSYGQRCGRGGVERRFAEGFLVPIGGREAARVLAEWFRLADIANLSEPDGLTEEQLQELAGVLRGIHYSLSDVPTAGPGTLTLELDTSRRSEITEGWIPVRTANRPAILLFS